VGLLQSDTVQQVYLKNSEQAEHTYKVTPLQAPAPLFV